MLRRSLIWVNWFFDKCREWTFACMSVIATQPLFVLRLPFIRCFGKAVRDEFRGGWVGGGGWGFSRPPPTIPDTKCYIHGKFWIFWINLGHFSFYFSPTIPFFLPVIVCKIAKWVANSVDRDQTPRGVLRRPTWVYTLCSGLSVRIRRVSTVIWLNQTPQKSSWIRLWLCFAIVPFPYCLIGKNEK